MRGLPQRVTSFSNAFTVPTGIVVSNIPSYIYLYTIPTGPSCNINIRVYYHVPLFIIIINSHLHVSVVVS
ncbi:hypothetical protein F4820DRAFT_304097 [Hypoxylon rubiginosum]|uniref:Uncharacterized protein n=1 Tax=Hypoxylon rubiginosum TaxID=110542 RepID=A0ACB9Z0V5_9PEZI|nr:hypothetical protein F4820DRAFT_304097 [Hypoxylon rubiginosum]